jgi:hypothetical protein
MEFAVWARRSFGTEVFAFSPPIRPFGAVVAIPADSVVPQGATFTPKTGGSGSVIV